MATTPADAHLPDVHLEPYGNLWLDPANPRLAELKLNIKEQDRILHWLWKNKEVSELVDSMLAGATGPMKNCSLAKNTASWL